MIKRGFVKSEFEREDIIKKWLTVHKPERIKFLGFWPEHAGVPKGLRDCLDSAAGELGGDQHAEWLRAIPLGADLNAVYSNLCTWSYDAEFKGLTEQQRAQTIFDNIMELTRQAKPFETQSTCPTCGRVSIVPKEAVA